MSIKILCPRCGEEWNVKVCSNCGRKVGEAILTIDQHEELVQSLVRPINRSKLVKEFATEYMSRLADGRMEAPSGGDCWFCVLREVDTSRPMGDLNQSNHMISHLEDKYYVPSIIMNALDELGGSPAAKDYVARRFNNIDGGYTYGGLISEQLYRTLVRYVGSKVGLGR